MSNPAAALLTTRVADRLEDSSTVTAETLRWKYHRHGDVTNRHNALEANLILHRTILTRDWLHN